MAEVDIRELMDLSSRDYNSIANNLIALAKNISQDWVPTNETDPGMVFIKLAATLGDMLSYNRDLGVLSLSPQTVMERGNAQNVFQNVGYYMHWYRSARCKATIISNDTKTGYLTKFTVFKTQTGNTSYVYLGEQVSIPTATNIKSLPLEIELKQGYPFTPTLLAETPVRKHTTEWHEPYGYNVYVENLSAEHILCLSDMNVDEDSLYLVDDQGQEWTLTRDVDTVESTRQFQFSINTYGVPYIRLACDPRMFNIQKFKLFYVISSGKDGRIAKNTLSQIPVTKIYDADIKNLLNQKLTITNEASTGGYGFETADEARKKYAKYRGTIDTLVTIADFENATKQVEGILNCRAYDNQRNSYVLSKYLGLPDLSKTYSTQILLPDNFSFWFPAFKVYCGSDLIFDGIERITTTQEFVLSPNTTYPITLNLAGKNEIKSVKLQTAKAEAEPTEYTSDQYFVEYRHPSDGSEKVITVLTIIGGSGLQSFSKNTSGSYGIYITVEYTKTSDYSLHRSSQDMGLESFELNSYGDDTPHINDCGFKTYHTNQLLNGSIDQLVSTEARVDITEFLCDAMKVKNLSQVEETGVFNNISIDSIEVVCDIYDGATIRYDQHLYFNKKNSLFELKQNSSNRFILTAYRTGVENSAYILEKDVYVTMMIPKYVKLPLSSTQNVQKILYSNGSYAPNCNSIVFNEETDNTMFKFTTGYSVGYEASTLKIWEFSVENVSQNWRNAVEIGISGSSSYKEITEGIPTEVLEELLSRASSYGSASALIGEYCDSTFMTEGIDYLYASLPSDCVRVLDVVGYDRTLFDEPIVVNDQIWLYWKDNSANFVPTNLYVNYIPHTYSEFEISAVEAAQLKSPLSSAVVKGISLDDEPYEYNDEIIDGELIDENMVANKNLVSSTSSVDYFEAFPTHNVDKYYYNSNVFEFYQEIDGVQVGSTGTYYYNTSYDIDTVLEIMTNQSGTTSSEFKPAQNYEVSRGQTQSTIYCYDQGSFEGTRKIKVKYLAKTFAQNSAKISTLLRVPNWSSAETRDTARSSGITLPSIFEAYTDIDYRLADTSGDHPVTSIEIVGNDTKLFVRNLQKHTSNAYSSLPETGIRETVLSSKKILAVGTIVTKGVQSYFQVLDESCYIVTGTQQVTVKKSSANTTDFDTVKIVIYYLSALDSTPDISDTKTFPYFSSKALESGKVAPSFSFSDNKFTFIFSNSSSPALKPLTQYFDDNKFSVEMLYSSNNTLKLKQDSVGVLSKKHIVESPVESVTITLDTPCYSINEISNNGVVVPIYIEATKSVSAQQPTQITLEHIASTVYSVLASESGQSYTYAPIPFSWSENKVYIEASHLPSTETNYVQVLYAYQNPNVSFQMGGNTVTINGEFSSGNVIRVVYNYTEQNNVQFKELNALIPNYYGTISEDGHLKVYNFDNPSNEPLWCEYKSYIAQNTVLLSSIIEDNYNKTTVLSNVIKYIDQKKHLALDTLIAESNPLTLMWQPKGTIYLSKEISTAESQAMISGIDVLLRESYRAGKNGYNTPVSQMELMDLIKGYSSIIKYVDIDRPEYYIRPTGIDTPATISYEKTQTKNMTGTITLDTELSFGFKTGSEENMTYAYYDLPQEFNVVPGSFVMNLNYGELIVRDKLGNYDAHGGHYKDEGDQSENFGGLYSLQSNLGIKSKITYDSGTHIEIYVPGLAYFGNVQATITYETDTDIITAYDGYDAKQFYISSKNIKELNRGGAYDSK